MSRRFFELSAPIIKGWDVLKIGTDLNVIYNGLKEGVVGVAEVTAISEDNYFIKVVLDDDIKSLDLYPTVSMEKQPLKYYLCLSDDHLAYNGKLKTVREQKERE